MQSNILLSPLPTAITICGAEYEIDTDFRTAIRFTQLMQRADVDDVTKLDIAIFMFFGATPLPDLQEAVARIMQFYRCGKDIKKTTGKAVEMAQRIYDYEYDADLIYAAFLEQYGLDLQDIPYMHWWKFRALFSGLSEQTEFLKIVGYRAIKITDSMTKEQKQHYRALKAQYALPDNRSEEEKDRAFARSLASV